jgi:hypothetical protein
MPVEEVGQPSRSLCVAASFNPRVNKGPVRIFLKPSPIQMKKEHMSPSLETAKANLGTANEVFTASIPLTACAGPQGSRAHALSALPLAPTKSSQPGPNPYSVLVGSPVG